MCHKKFAEESNLTQHMEMHDGKEREFVVCTDCGQTFRQFAQLKFVEIYSRINTIKIIFFFKFF